jgi:hypothetical protein
MPFNVRQVRHERKAKLDFDDRTFAFVNAIDTWAAQNPEVNTFVYDGVPPGFHDWGVTGAWNLAHNRIDLRALYIKWPETGNVLTRETVAYGSWDQKRRMLRISIRPPGY